MKKTFRTGSVYYNEIDPAACVWLRELMKKGMIPEGEIDDRSIADVEPDDLKSYAQCHFFAGIGGWPLALQLAGARDLECWTGSCPCQPFSNNGERRGIEDERHLWPAFHRLIAERRPQLVVGEQVEAAIAHGWLDLVSSGLEAVGYACGAAVLGAHSVGAPHVRQRLYWGGVLGDARREGGQPPYEAAGGGGREGHGVAQRPGEAGVLGHANDGGQVGPLRGEPGEAGVLAHANGLQHEQDAGGARGEVTGARGVGDACAGVAAGRGGAARRGFWDGCDWLPCRDGKARPAEPGTLPLAHGVPRRVELLKGYGNAIVPQVAAEFVKALIG
jgi:DNA (cytosine-5)-methyltransferase 1